MSLTDRIKSGINEWLAPSGEAAIKQMHEYTDGLLELDPDDPKSTGRDDGEIGDPGTELWANIYQSVPDFNDSIPLKTYDQMRHGIGTMQAILRILQLPILATNWSIVAGDDDKEGERSKFVTEVLQKMEIPMQQVLIEAMASFWAGFKMQEIVWRTDGSSITISKIAPRSPHTTKPVLDRHGNIVGVYQQSIFMGNSTNVFIPMHKVWWYTHRMEDGNYYGQSDFKAAYPHYENLRKLYIIDNKTHEVTAIPIRIAKPNIMGVAKNVRESVFRKIRKIGLDTAVWIPKEVDLEFGPQIASGATRADSINHHTTQMAMSVLAHFLQLGTNGSGTYNLSSDQSDMFLMMETAEMKSMAWSFNRNVIEPLVKLNFDDDSRKMPRLIFSDMTDHVRKTTEAIFLAIAQQGNRLSDEFVEALSQRVVDELGLDLNVTNRQGDDVPTASVSQEEIDEHAMEKFEETAEITGKMKDEGEDKTGGANQKTPKIAKQQAGDTAPKPKANFSADDLSAFASASVNSLDYFGRVKLAAANVAGVPAPSTPADIKALVLASDIGSETNRVALAHIATTLVSFVSEEG